MKVFDLHCGQFHVFEGWFASELDFVSQRERGLIECPVCGDASVTKKLSAPRLNLGSVSTNETHHVQAHDSSAHNESLQSAWMSVARQIIANTDDVGSSFAEEARKIHYGEIPERGIRGKATSDETTALLEEGISIMSLPLPEALKGQLQ